MTGRKVYTAIGLMSGTSLDGVDAALIRTDGHDVAEPLGFVSLAYEAALRDKLRACLGRSDRDAADIREAERLMTAAHVEAVRALPGADGAEVIGFHGQTILHNPRPLIKKGGSGGVTVQLGDAGLLAAETGIDVVHDFRSADVRAGGQGAPFLPLYHRARAAKLDKPLAVLNIGGVANVTYINNVPPPLREGVRGRVLDMAQSSNIEHPHDSLRNHHPPPQGGGDYFEGEILAFDTGPGNALLDDFVRERTGRDFDEYGKLAEAGKVAEDILAQWMEHPYFKSKPPKSLDRNAWDVSDVKGLNDADGAATLAAFTARAVIAALDHMPQKPKAWYVTGGGRKNETIMNYLKTHLKNVAPVEDIGWNGDALEAEGFAYLAVRSLLGLPLSVPGTTGVKTPMTGGVLTRCR